MPAEVIMPKVDMDMTCGTIAAWHVEDGGKVEKGDPLFDIETDKATMEVESPASGTLHFVSASPGDIVDIGTCIAWLFCEGETIEKPNRPGAATGPAAPALPSISPAPVSAADPASVQETLETAPASISGESAKILATPLARRIAGLKGIDLGAVSGSGPRGRISRKDVDAHVPATAAPSVIVPRTGSAALKSQLEMLGIGYDAVPADRMRQTIAARLTESTSTVPHFYLEIDCRVDRLMAFRKEANEALEDTPGRRISVNDMLVRACAQALEAVPQANASWAGDEILRYRDANISVAVSVDGGLITPVVRQAQKKSLTTISAEIADLAERARSGRLKGHEYKGGSFSISNLGMHGIRSFAAIINPPESMILAVGKAERRFIENDKGEPVGATMMSVTLSCDHRVVDGALGARWLAAFRKSIENPVLLGMDLG